MPRQRTQIKGDFGNNETLDYWVAETAAKAVVLNANDTDEAKLFLDMLGLIVPQPGFEPTTLEKRKKLDAVDRRKRNRETERLKNVTPEEIGE